MATEQDCPPSPPVIQRDYREPNSSRKTIAFIKAQTSSTLFPIRSEGARSLGDSYLSVVLPSATISMEHLLEDDESPGEKSSLTCEICHLPLSGLSNSPGSSAINRHESSLAHQVCLSHTHPPSAINRSRKGFAYLHSYGWDPDARKGLGSVDREGILYPITAKEKKNKAGIGAVAPSAREKSDKVQKMNIKEARSMAKKDKTRSERLQRMFYSNGDLERYLGSENL